MFQYVVYIYHSILDGYFSSNFKFEGAGGEPVGWGTALQVKRSRVRFPVVSLEFLIDNLPGRTVALWLTQPPTETSTGNIFWGVKAADAQGWQRYHIHVLIVLKSGSLKLLEPSRPVQACNGDLYFLLYIMVCGSSASALL